MLLLPPLEDEEMAWKVPARDSVAPRGVVVDDGEPSCQLIPLLLLVLLLLPLLLPPLLLLWLLWMLLAVVTLGVCTAGAVGGGAWKPICTLICVLTSESMRDWCRSHSTGPTFDRQDAHARCVRLCG